MDRFDHLAPLTQACTHETPCPQQGDELWGRVAGVRCDSDGRHGQRAAAHGHDLEQTPRVLGQARRALSQDLVERDHAQRGHALAIRRAMVSGRAARQLLDQERVAARLARDARGNILRGGLARAQKRGGQATRIVERERLDLDLAYLGALGPSPAQIRKKGTGRRVFRAVRRHQQDWRRRGRPHHLHEEGGAVGVAPLNVVDEDDDRVPRREGPEKLAQGAERKLPEDLRVAGRGLRERVDPRYAPEHGKEVRERPDGVRQRQLRLLHQVPCERVDDAVDRLVGHRFPLVDPPAKDEDLSAALEGIELAEIVVNEGRLAEAGPSGDSHSHGAAVRGRLERVGQRPDLQRGRRSSPTGRGWASDGRYVDPAPRSGRALIAQGRLGFLLAGEDKRTYPY